MDWSELPDITDVRDSLKKHAELKSKVRIAELQLEVYKATMARAKPRDASVRLIGIDENTRLDLCKLREELMEAQRELDSVEADIRFNEYRKEAAKIMSYKGKV